MVWLNVVFQHFQKKKKQKKKKKKKKEKQNNYLVYYISLRFSWYCAT